MESSNVSNGLLSNAIQKCQLCDLTLKKVNGLELLLRQTSSALEMERAKSKELENQISTLGCQLMSTLAAMEKAVTATQGQTHTNVPQSAALPESRNSHSLNSNVNNIVNMEIPASLSQWQQDLANNDDDVPDSGNSSGNNENGQMLGLDASEPHARRSTLQSTGASRARRSIQSNNPPPCTIINPELEIKDEPLEIDDFDGLVEEFFEEQGQSDEAFSPREDTKPITPIRTRKRKVPDPNSVHRTFCRVCKAVFRNRAMLLEHTTETGHDMRFSCNICHRKFKQRIQLTRHMEQKHRLGEDYACNRCGRQFKNEYSRRRHEANDRLHESMERSIQDCFVCGLRLARRNSWAMRQHVRTHTNEEIATKKDEYIALHGRPPFPFDETDEVDESFNEAIANVEVVETEK